MLNVLAAVFFSLVSPGAGQFYNGQPVKGIIIALLFILLPSMRKLYLARAVRGLTEEMIKAGISSTAGMSNLSFAKTLNVIFVCAIVVSLLDAVLVSWQLHSAGLVPGSDRLWKTAVFAAVTLAFFQAARSSALLLIKLHHNN